SRLRLLRDPTAGFRPSPDTLRPRPFTHEVSPHMTAPINVGIVFPHTEISGDPAAVRDFAVTAEALGFSHVMAFDHVLGVNATANPGYANRYNSGTPFTDPFVLFAYMAAATTRLGFITSVLVLPQRQTALVAKQAADLALLSGGRLRLGV